MSASLRELGRRADALPPTHFDAADLMRQGEARLRRRRLAAAAGAVVAVVLAVGLAGAALSGDERAQVPAQNPSPSQTESASTGEEWTPERIRAEGSPGDPQGAITATESGLATYLYEVCDGSRCSHDDGSVEDLRVAIEVTQDGRSAVFDLRWSAQPWVRVFDEDSVLVQDAEHRRPGGPVRYRLLQADGTAVQLHVVEGPARPVPGPGVFVIEDWSGWNAGMAGVEEVYLVDDRAGTLRPLDVPEDVRYWGPNLDEFLWGVTDDCRVFWATAGTFEERQLDCSEGLDFTYGINADEFPPGWLEPGRMAIGEQSDGRGADQNFVHVSLDSGATWQRIPVRDDDDLADVLQQLR